MKDIHCIDFSLLGDADELEEDELEKEVKKISERIVSAFSEIGFVYFKNHGIPQNLIENIHKVGEQFFSLPEKQKLNNEKDPEEIQGYVAMNRELLHESKDVQELRESFDVSNPNGKFPSEVECLKETVLEVMKEGIKFSNKLLKCLEIGLEIPKGTLIEKHQRPFSSYNGSVLRILHYPPIPEDAKEGSIRCGAHTDYGTFTLLFQDDKGGLEVKRKDGKWIYADPIPNTILVNAGDLLQMWTAGSILATPHRVLVPKEEVLKRCSRRSVVLFFHPDNDVIVKPLDGSSVYPPIGAGEYLKQRFDSTFEY